MNGRRQIDSRMNDLFNTEMQECHHLLILGAGWTATFLIPLLRARSLSFAATTRDGRTVAEHPTQAWTFDPDDTSPAQFHSLPLARNILITFPIVTSGASTRLVHGYNAVWKHRLDADGARFVQLGSTGIWSIPANASRTWIDRHSPHSGTSARAQAEDELLATTPAVGDDGGGDGGGDTPRNNAAVLNLAGLWGGTRQPRDWRARVAKTKDDVRGKTSLHMVHGVDVGRAVLAILARWEAARGQRWMLTDGFVYDWWALFAGWADVEEGRSSSAAAGARDDDSDATPAQTAQWVSELMRPEEGDVRALPRSMEALGRCYDSREFWATFGLVPLKARI